MKGKYSCFFIILFSLFYSMAPLHAQKDPINTVQNIAQTDSSIQPIPQKDLIDNIREFTKSKKPPPDTYMKVGRLYKSLLPVIGYGPAYGVVVGAGVSFSTLLGDKKNTHISSALLNANITSQKQFYINFRSNIYLPNDQWILQGDFRIMFYSQPTYGLGIQKNENDSGQNMRFDYLRIYEKAYRKIAKNFYMGMGLQLDRHFKIIDESLDTVLPGIRITDHFQYSKKNGYDPEQYTAIGFTFDFLYDSRDNAINCYKGAYAQLSFRNNSQFLGSTKSSSSLFMDLRKYFNLSRNAQAKNKSILAFWGWGQILTSGDMPYLALPSLGWDTYNRSGRGFVQGRFRGDDMVYLEAEYRFPLTANGFLGGVAFANGTTASSKMEKQLLFNSTAIGYGLGLRVKMDKKSRTNIGIDLGFENLQTRRIYFTLQECF
jgi:outer membrane protein assembly factor BamA